MDDPGIDREELARSLRFIRFVNRRLGGSRVAVASLRRWVAPLPRDQVVRVIDIGTGSADIPLAIVRWAEQEGRRVHVTAVDLHETTLELARELIGERRDVELLQADALQLMDRFDVGSFHFAHAGMFLHHLSDLQVMTVLRIMDRLAQRGLIWNDLVRARWDGSACAS